MELYVKISFISIFSLFSWFLNMIFAGIGDDQLMPLGRELLHTVKFTGFCVFGGVREWTTLSPNVNLTSILR